MIVEAGLKSATATVAVVFVSVPVEVDVAVDEVVEEVAVAAFSCSRRSLDSWCRHFMRRFWNQTFTCGRES